MSCQHRHPTQPSLHGTRAASIAPAQLPSRKSNRALSVPALEAHAPAVRDQSFDADEKASLALTSPTPVTVHVASVNYMRRRAVQKLSGGEIGHISEGPKGPLSFVNGAFVSECDGIRLDAPAVMSDGDKWRETMNATIDSCHVAG